MARSALLGRFRERWVAGALPMVIEHRSDTVETLCASPSLWMGGRAFAQELAEHAIGPEAPIAFDRPLGIEFVQALIGTLRSGAAVDLRPWAAGAPRHRLRPTGLEPCSGAEAVPAEVAWIGPDGSHLSREDLDRRIPAAARRLELGPGQRVQVGTAAHDAASSAEAILAPLWAECELHVLMDPDAHRSPVFVQAPPERRLGVAP